MASCKNISSGFIVAISLLAHASPVVATEVQDANAAVDEVVIDTSYRVPLVKQPMPFENFRYPFFDNDGSVLFIGNDFFTFGARENSGIYRSNADGTLEVLATQDQPSPDDGQPIGIFMGLQTDFKSVLFHRGPDRGVGIYGWFEGGPLTAVANTKTLVPGSLAPFAWFWYGDVNNGLVVFTAAQRIEENDQIGLYFYRHRDRKIWTLLNEKTPVPALAGKPLTRLAYQPRLDSSWIVFSADEADTARRGIFGWSLQQPAGNALPEEALTSIDKLQILAAPGMEIPESGGRILTQAPNPVVENGVVAVRGDFNKEQSPNKRDHSADYAAILVRTPDGIWKNPIDTDTLIPGRSDGATFTGFNKWLSLANGRVIFRAYGPRGYEAIYLYAVAEEKLFFVIDTLREIDGKQVRGYEVSTKPMNGDRLAFMARFTDGSSGEYLATLPGLAVQPTRAPR